MLIFNTTFHIEDSIHDECLTYLKQVYIPQSLQGGLLEQALLARVQAVHEESGTSYAVQFKTKDVDALNEWAATVGGRIQKELTRKFGNKISGFSTLLEEIPLL